MGSIPHFSIYIAPETGLLELLFSDTLTSIVCVLPSEIGSCATCMKTDNAFREVRGSDDPCDTVVEEDTVLGDTCAAWLLIDEY
jgi:hypothetical protein